LAEVVAAAAVVGQVQAGPLVELLPEAPLEPRAAWRLGPEQPVVGRAPVVEQAWVGPVAVAPRQVSPAVRAQPVAPGLRLAEIAPAWW
jgi:hypothetical protein